MSPLVLCGLTAGHLAAARISGARVRHAAIGLAALATPATVIRGILRALGRSRGYPGRRAQHDELMAGEARPGIIDPGRARSGPGAAGPRPRAAGSGDRPVLGVGAVAGVDLHLGAWGGGGTRVVETLARRRVEQGAVRLRLPGLGGAAVACLPLDLGAVDGTAAGDGGAAAHDLEGAAGADGP